MEDELRESLERAFWDYGKPLYNVTLFKYMGRVMTAGYYNWMEVAGNLQKAGKSWGRMLRFLSQERVYPKVLEHSLNAVV